MKTLVIFYSYTGNSRKIATEYAQKGQYDIQEITDRKRPGVLGAYTIGCFRALGGVAGNINPLDYNLDEYERLALFFPIWASSAPPAINALLELVPSTKAVAVTAVSGSGKSTCEDRIRQILKEKDCVLESFEDIKAAP